MSLCNFENAQITSQDTLDFSIFWISICYSNIMEKTGEPIFMKFPYLSKITKQNICLDSFTPD